MAKEEETWVIGKRRDDGEGGGWVARIEEVGKEQGMEEGRRREGTRRLGKGKGEMMVK